MGEDLHAKHAAARGNLSTEDAAADPVPAKKAAKAKK